MAISTKNIKSDEGFAGGQKPILSPGNHKIKILSVELRKDKNWEKYGDNLIFKVLAPIPGFKGVAINKDHPEQGNYEGQIGFVQYSRWNFRDDVLTNGIEIFRIEEILKALKTISDELKIPEWLDNADSKYETIEQLVEAFNSEAPFKVIVFYAVINGREYMNGQYLNYNLFFPRIDRTLGKPFSLQSEKVIKFFESTGIEKLKPKADSIVGIIESIEKKEPAIDDSVAAFLESINAPVEQTYHKDLQTDPNQPVRPPVTSAAEAAFMNENKIATPITDAILNDTKEDSKQDIITGSGDNPYMPWDAGFEQWEKDNKK